MSRKHPPFNRLTAGIVLALYGAILPTRHFSDTE